MQRLLKDASAITGEKYKMGNMADIVQAINAIQKQNGITGTTEAEARGTIQGSKMMLSAAWENVLTALAAPEDLDLSGAIASLTDSAKTYLNNLFPVVSKIMDGLGTFMEEVLPDVMEKLPEMIADFAPKLVKAGKKMFEGFGKGLKRVAEKINWPTWDDMKGAIQGAWQTVTKGFDGLGKLIFGEKADGTTNWPTAGQIIEKIKEIWGEVEKAFEELGSIVFGKKADGTTDWPTAEEIFKTIKGIWDDVLNQAESLVPMIFGENSAISDALTNAIHFIQDFGDWVTEHWGEVQTGLLAIGEAFAAWKVAEIVSSLSPLRLILLGISVIVALIAANWDTVKQKMQEFHDWIQGKAGEFALWCTNNLVAPMVEFIEKIREALNILEQIFGIGSTGNADWTGPDQTGKKDLDDYTIATVGRPHGRGVNPHEEIDKAANADKTVETAANGADKEQKNLNKTLTETGTKGKQAAGDIAGGMGLTAMNTEKAVGKVAELAAELNGLPKSKTVTIFIKTVGSVPRINGSNITAGAGAVASVYKGKAKGDWNVPYDNYLASLHRGEMVLTKSQARQYREGNSGGKIDAEGLAASIVAAIREGMAGASVNSYLDGKAVTGRVNRRNNNQNMSRRFVTA